MEHKMQLHPHLKRKRRRRIILISVLVLLIGVRIALPYVILDYANKTLSTMKDYTGHVEDIDLALIRGAYVIKDIKIERINTESEQKDTIPFFSSPEIDLSVEWRAIFKGKIVGELAVEDPVLNFVKGKHKEENVKQDTSDFKAVIKDLMPLTINRFEINNGQIHYIDQGNQPVIDVAMKDLQVLATNMSNVNDSNKLLPSHLEASGNAYEGEFKLGVDFDGLNKVPTFDMNARISDVNMVMLNDFFKAYGNFDVKKGNFGLYTEFAAKNGEFAGYVKPLLKDMDIVQWNKEEGDMKQILWETLIGGVAEIFQNQRKDQLATKVPINGKFENPDVDMWNAISYVLRNAFVYALQPSIDNTINIGKVEEETSKKTFLQKIFGKDKDKNKQEDKNKGKGNKKKKEKSKEKERLASEDSDEKRNAN